MREFIGTFGCGWTLGKSFVRVEAVDHRAAYAVMRKHYGEKWSMIYESEAQAGAEKFKLQEVPLGTPNERKP